MKAETLKRKAEQFHARFDTELKGEYIRMSEYTGMHELLTARHIPCGEIRTAAARDFFRKGCPVCSMKNMVNARVEKKATENIRKIEAEYNVTAISKFKSVREPMRWRCSLCGAIIERPVEYILWRTDESAGMKHDCYAPYNRLIRALKKRLRQVEAEERAEARETERREEIKALCNKYRANGYRIIKVYDDMQRVALQHLLCGRKYTTDKKRMRNGYGCKECAKKGLSFGVQQVMTYLDAHDIPYRREVCFNTCRIERPLPFDFIVYDTGGRPTHAIEFNGEHHYRPLKHFGGADKFSEIQAADRTKAEWCKREGLPLLFIRYDADVENELKNFL